MNALQRFLREHMDALGLKPAQLARRARMPLSTLSNLLNNETLVNPPRYETLAKLTAGLQAAGARVELEDVQRAAYAAAGMRLEVTEVEIDGEPRKRLTVIIKDLDEDDVEDLLAMAEAKQRRRDS